MNDIVKAKVCMTDNGKAYTSNTDEYSIAQYAYSQLRKNGSAEALKLLCVDLLQYGTAAQRFKGYRTNALADSQMDLDELMLMTELKNVTFQNINETVDFPSQILVNWGGKALDLTSKVGIKYVVDLTGYSGNIADLNLRIRYTDSKGVVQTAVLTNMEEYRVEAGLYAFTFNGLLASELRTPLEAVVCQGDTAVSTTIRYSPDTYGNGRTGNLLTLCRALFAYVDSAKAYFVN
jgi:hypothetical protein